MSLSVLGIRHHGPGSARSVLTALSEDPPEVLLIEAPGDAGAALQLVGDPEMRPPVALLGYVADRPERASFSPFAAFSPEWVALRHAATRGIPVRAIDLPLANALAGPGDGRDTGPGRVDPLGELAAAAGAVDAEQWWEDVVEHRGDGAPAFVAIGEAMSAVRSGRPDPTGLEAAREAAMRNGVRAARRDGFRRIAVVCGAWHVPAILAVDDVSAAADAAVLRGLPRVKVTATWVPWTHRRLAAASGYGAGVASPGWYAHVFEHDPQRAAVAWCARAAELLRIHDLPAVPDDVVAAVRAAEALAVLRGRPRAGLEELEDATLATLARGRSGPLELVREHLVVGDEIGAVSSRAPMVPLARDLLRRQRSVRLAVSGIGRTLELDVREPSGRARSHLLHQLWLLDVPWGRPHESRASTGTFRETWHLRWEPELDVRLVEESHRGTTVAAAAASRLAERSAGAATIVELTEMIERALLADLADEVAGLVRRLSRRAATGAGVEQLADALGPLARALRYGDARSTDASLLESVVDGIVERVCIGLPPAVTSLDDDAAGAAAERLLAVQSVLVMLDHPARTTAWPAALRGIADRSTVHGIVRGRATRLLHDSVALPPGDLEARLARALSPGAPVADAAAFVEGVLAGSGTVLLHDDGLLAVLDAWVCGLPDEQFRNVVALLRRTFGSFEAAERRRLGQLVAGGPPRRSPAPYGWDLDPGRAAEAERTVRVLFGLEA